MKLTLIIRSVIVLNHISLCCLPLTHAFIFLLIDFSSFDEKLKLILHLTYFN